MARRMRSRRVPEVLRRAYGDTVRSLADTVLSFLPAGAPLSSPAECSCRGRGCFGCGGEPFLLRPDDGPEYRRLLNRVFCAVPPDAPRPAGGDLYFENNWTLRLIVRNTIELILDKVTVPANSLCDGFSKQTRTSPNGDFFCTSSWHLLLTRIGDPIMIFLLKFSSIFIPLSNKVHHQVSGPPLNKAIQSSRSVLIQSPLLLSKHKQDVIANDDVIYGSNPKRRHVKCRHIAGADSSSGNNKQPEIEDTRLVKSLEIHPDSRKNVPVSLDKICYRDYSSYSSCDYTQKCGRLPSWQRRRQKRKLNNIGESSLRICFADEYRDYYSGDSQMRPPSCSSSKSAEQIGPLNHGGFTKFFCSMGKNAIKHSQLSSWQRVKKQRKIDKAGGSFLQNCLFINANEENINENEENLDNDKFHLKELPNLHLHYTEQMPPSSCEITKLSGLQTGNAINSFKNIPSMETGGAVASKNKFGKKHMTSKCFCCSLLQALPNICCNEEIERKYMFYNFKPSSSIFPKNHVLNRLKPNVTGATSLLKNILGISHLNTQILPCSSDGDFCIQPNCMYHSLVRLLKVLIRNARRCQYLKLLHKHCLVSIPGMKRERLSLEKLHRQDTDFHQKDPKTQNSEFAPNECYCGHQQVVAFIWAVCRSTIPPDLLGDTYTWRTLRKNISKFIRLRRFEKFSLKQCIIGLRTSCFSFLSRSMHHSSCSYCAKYSDAVWKDATDQKRPVKYSTTEIVIKNKIFKRWIYWLFSYIIVPVVTATFYVTESETGRMDLFYYPKPHWRKLVYQAITSLKQQTYKAVKPTLVRELVSTRSFGFSKVRFLPKGKGLRPLANLKAPCKLWFPVRNDTHKMCFVTRRKSTQMHQGQVKACNKGNTVCFKSVNSALHDLDAILKRIKVEHPEYLGASVFDYNDVYQILHPFIRGLRNSSATMSKVYIVVSDVTKAYDSINQDRLLAIMKEIIHKDDYHSRRYAHVICTTKSLGALYGPVSFDQDRRITDSKFAASVRLCSCRGVLVDQGTSRRIKKDRLHHLLHEHVKCNLVQLGRGLFLQKVGISQGSLLSSLLCSFYYGDMERSTILPFLRKIQEQFDCTVENSGKSNITVKDGMTRKTNCLCPYTEPVEDNVAGIPIKASSFDEVLQHASGVFGKSLNAAAAYSSSQTMGSNISSFRNCVLLRLIDDFLFISTSEKMATGFLNRLRRGFRQYNCFMNSEKFGKNFETGNDSKSLPSRLHTVSDGISFLPWSGLLINCQTLEIQADYTRYWDVHMSSTITVWAHSKPGQHLKTKLCDYMRPKCHPIFYDSNINSPAIVRLNAYQAFLVCAMKFHCYLCALSKHSLSSEYCADTIQRSFSYMFKLIKKRMYDIERYGNIRPLLRLKKEEIFWLGLSAYVRVLKKKQSRHMELLNLLSDKLKTYGRMDDSSFHLKYAVDDCHSSLIWKIKY